MQPKLKTNFSSALQKEISVQEENYKEAERLNAPGPILKAIRDRIEKLKCAGIVKKRQRT